MLGNTSKRYPPELKARAVRMVAEVRGDHDSEWAAMAKVAQLLGVTTALGSRGNQRGLVGHAGHPVRDRWLCQSQVAPV
jgi:transposase-like protein